MTDEEFIRSRAKMNWSREMVRKTLGISCWKFRAILKAMPDVEWGPGHLSPDRVRWNEDRKGVSTPGKRRAQQQFVRAIRAKRSVWVGSQFKPIPEHMQDYAEYIDVGISQINRRLAKGMPLLDALFSSPMPSAAVYKHGNWSQKNG